MNCSSSSRKPSPLKRFQVNVARLRLADLSIRHVIQRMIGYPAANRMEKFRPLLQCRQKCRIIRYLDPASLGEQLHPRNERLPVNLQSLVRSERREHLKSGIAFLCQLDMIFQAIRRVIRRTHDFHVA